MGDWREEVVADLRDASDRLEVLGRAISGEPTEEQLGSLWRAYLAVEKSVAMIKVELDEENPGRFVDTRAFAVPDERQAVSFAKAKLDSARASFAGGDLVGSLPTLREARNYLRVLLAEKRRLRARRARSAET